MQSTFLKDAFSDGGTASSSRLLTALHSVVACGCLVGVTWHSHWTLPPGDALAGLAAFATVHYTVNRITTAWQNRNGGPAQGAAAG